MNLLLNIVKLRETLKAILTKYIWELIYGSGNDSRYSKIKIDARKEIGNPQPSTIHGYAVHRLNGDGCYYK